MQRTNMFARALAMASLIAAAQGDMAKLAAIPEYKSRGKGQGKVSGGKRSNSRPERVSCHYVDTKTRGRVWLQKENGARERLRRMRQMGKLSQVQVA